MSPLSSVSSYSDLIADGTGQLGSRLEAEILLAFVLGCERSWLYAHGDESSTSPVATRYRQLIERRRKGEPVAYLTGCREFYGLDFCITTDVLIPRPETELLIDLALGLGLPERARVVDLGCGSGCIALTLATQRPGWEITATDISSQALAVAETNRNRLGLESVQLVKGDLFAPLGRRRFDLVISNPPYVAADDPHLERGDVRFEPDRALTAGTDGLAVIGRIVGAAGHYLNPRGWLLLEHGHDQAGAVRQLMKDAGFNGVRSFADLAGIERATTGTMAGGAHKR